MKNVAATNQKRLISYYYYFRFICLFRSMVRWQAHHLPLFCHLEGQQTVVSICSEKGSNETYFRTLAFSRRRRRRRRRRLFSGRIECFRCLFIDLNRQWLTFIYNIQSHSRHVKIVAVHWELHKPVASVVAKNAPSVVKDDSMLVGKGPRNCK